MSDNAPRVGPAQSPRLDILVYGSAGWDDPWLTEHNLAQALAGHARVLYVDPPRSVLSPVRHGLSRAALRQALALIGRRLTQREGVGVLKPLMLPPVQHPRARRFSRPLLRRQVGHALRTLEMDPTIAVVTRGVFEGFPKGERPFVVVIVKDWIRAGGHLTGLDAAALERQERATWSGADLIVTISRRIQERIGQEGFPAVLLRHGFNERMIGLSAAGVPSPALDGLPRPLLGCVGRIDDRWAFDALEELANRHPAGSVLLAGPVSPRVTRARLDRLLLRPNVHLLGPVSPAALPAFLAALDCCMVPYENDEWQSYASPLKIWDYLYAGRPIAATGSPALGEFPPGLIHYDEDAAALPELVAAALGEDRAAGLAARRQYALANTWSDRAVELLSLVADVKRARMGAGGGTPPRP